MIMASRNGVTPIERTLIMSRDRIRVGDIQYYTGPSHGAASWKTDLAIWMPKTLIVGDRNRYQSVPRVGRPKPHHEFVGAKPAIGVPTKIPLLCLKFLAEKRVEKPRENSCRRSYLRVDSTTVPLFTILLLLATKCIDGHDLRRGIVGDGGVKTPSVMAPFISLV